MRLVLNECTDPAFNLALEEYALTCMDPDLVILWRNAPSVIVGRNQNTFEEVDADYVRERGIAVIRRQSGGGAVFHDLGNVNYTIVDCMGQGDFNNYAKFTRPIVDYLRTLGVDAVLSGRNDLTIDGRKFCGNAQAFKNGRIMHHGCILYSADFTELAGALKPREIKVTSKGVKSVRQRVTNVIDHMPTPMPVEVFLDGLVNYFMCNIPGVERFSLNESDIEATRELVRQKYGTWDWNYGRSPAYNVEKCGHRPFGNVDVKLLVEGGVIRDARICGDFFGLGEVSELESRLIGARHDKKDIESRLTNYDVGRYIAGISLPDLLDLLC